MLAPTNLVAELMRSGRTIMLAMMLAGAALVAVAPRVADARDQDETAPRRGPPRGRDAARSIRWRTFSVRLRGKLPGEVAGVEIEHEGGRWRYEFRVVDSQGRLFEVYVDARSGEIERIKEK